MCCIHSPANTFCSFVSIKLKLLCTHLHSYAYICSHKTQKLCKRRKEKKWKIPTFTYIIISALIVSCFWLHRIIYTFRMCIKSIDSMPAECVSLTHDNIILLFYTKMKYKIIMHECIAWQYTTDGALHFSRNRFSIDCGLFLSILTHTLRDAEECTNSIPWSIVCQRLRTDE